MEVLQYLLSIKANIMCRDRFNGTPLERCCAPPL